MIIDIRSFLATLLVVTSFVAPTNASQNQQNAQAFNEDEVYWSRFVQESSFSISQPPSSPSPTSQPSPSPTTPAPTAQCQVDVRVDCVTLDGTPCEDLTAPSEPCPPGTEDLVSIVYTYTLSNIGGIDMDITLVERIRDGVTVDLLNQVAGANPLAPGDSVSVMEEETLDICLDGIYNTIIRAEADPIEGTPCFDEDEFEFEIANNCAVDVDITCVSTDGVPCTDLEEENGICSAGGDITTLEFRYVDSSCEDGSDKQADTSTCEEFNGGLTGGRITVICTDSDGNTIGTPSTVDVDDTFVVEAPTGMPTELTCTLSNTGGTTLQVVTFDASGTAELELKDRFGGLSLEACSDTNGNERDCLTDITYTFDIVNVGTNEMDVTVVEIERGDIIIDLIDEVEDKDLAPGESTTVTYTETLDLCVPGDYTTTVNVEADPPGSGMCEATETYDFDIDVVCDVFLEMDCLVVGGGDESCKDLTGEQEVECICEECPSELIFRYTGAGTLPGSVGLTVSSGGNDIASGTVAVGDDMVVMLTNGACLPDTMTVTLTDPASGTTLEETSINTLCNGEIDLLDSFGGVDFVGYTCREEPDTPHNCFVDVEYSYVVTNTGEVDLLISELERTINGDTKDLSAGFSLGELTLSPGEGFDTTETIEVELCTTMQYTACSSVTASAPDDTTAVCADEECINFDISVGTPFPSPSPSSSPTPAPSSPPTPAPTPSPSSPPSPSPSSPPSTSPTPQPTTSPSSLPTPSPSANPTPSPSASPTSSPSVSPTPEPTTPAPTTLTPPPSPSPTDACELDLSISCTPPLGAQSCETVPPILTICQERPFHMTFRYNGGDCSGSFNIQPDTLFQCEDFGARPGPPTEDGTRSYIEAFEAGGGELYFSGFAEVGGEFTALAEEKFSANMDINIYDIPADLIDTPEADITPEDRSNIVQPSNLVQTVVYHSSCSQNLFLKDRFGAVQLVLFINNEQGVVSCFQNATLSFDIDVPIDIVGGRAELTSLTIITNIDNGNNGVYDLSDIVAGQIIEPGVPFQTGVSIEIDLTVRQKYTALSTIVGKTDEGQGCFGTDFYEFEAGNPLPPIFPTLAPSAAPTITPLPTPDPDTSACNLEADIQCRRPGGGSCDLSSPEGQTCDGSNANFLQFIYIPTELCDGNNTQDKFKCSDENLDIPRPDTVFIIIAKKDDVFFQGSVTSGQIFDVPIPGNEKDVEIEIFTADGGDILQESKMSIRCREEDALTLLTTFGHLQLVGYRNTEEGLQQTFADIELSYVVENGGVLDADLIGAFKNSAFSGFSSLLDDGERITLSSGGTEIFTELFTVNLAASAGLSFEFSFLVNGEGTQSGTACQDTDLFTLRVLD